MPEQIWTMLFTKVLVTSMQLARGSSGWRTRWGNCVGRRGWRYAKQHRLNATWIEKTLIVDSWTHILVYICSPPWQPQFWSSLLSIIAQEKTELWSPAFIPCQRQFRSDEGSVQMQKAILHVNKTFSIRVHLGQLMAGHSGGLLSGRDALSALPSDFASFVVSRGHSRWCPLNAE